jgi:Arc/MetJ-type ribon-helix-helix transcriptional regulator
MAVMIHRTTLALDEATVNRIRKLAHTWGVSQSEAVRRAVQLAERRADEEQSDPLERLEAYHEGGGLDRRQADAYLQEVADNRSFWRDGR